MIKTLKQSLINERFKRPRAPTAQKSIPIDRIFEDGIWKVNRSFSRTWQFSDINYTAASRDDKSAVYFSYCDILNTLPTDATAKVTIFSHRLDRGELARNMLIPERGDNLDSYRDEINGHILAGADSNNGIFKERFITISSQMRSIAEARPYFSRIESELSQTFGRLSSSVAPLGIKQRLKILHDFFRAGEVSKFKFDMTDAIKSGYDFKDSICPSAISFHPGYFTMGEKFGRVLFVSDYASSLKDEFIKDLTDMPLDMMLSIDILPAPTSEAVKEVSTQVLALESDIYRWQRRQNNNNNFHAQVPYELSKTRETLEGYLDDLTSHDQRLMFGVVTLVHLADSKEQLDLDTKAIQAAAQKSVCAMRCLFAQQEAALNTVLPYGIRPIEAVRTFTTSSVGGLIPFNCQEVMHKGGLYFGQNTLSNNPIVCDRMLLQNPHAWILGVSGSGKSMYAKFLIAQIILATDADVIVFDPEAEYSPPITALGGVSLTISASSPNHINAFDLDAGYGAGDDPVRAKSEFILSLCEIIMKPKVVGADEKSMIDRCVKKVYESYVKGGFTGQAPTFKDFYDVLLEQPEALAREIALSIELFTTGSLDVFSKPTNVNTESRIVSYNLNKLGSQLRDVGMLVTLDSILNRVSANRLKGKQTYVFVDEMDIFYKHEYSASFFDTAWRRFRKYGAPLTGISQHAAEMLKNEVAATMLQGSELIVLNNSAAEDRAKLAEILNIPQEQLGKITNAEKGHGLIRIGRDIVPFSNVISEDLGIYKLLSTKPGEGQ